MLLHLSIPKQRIFHRPFPSQNFLPLAPLLRPVPKKTVPDLVQPDAIVFDESHRYHVNELFKRIRSNNAFLDETDAKVIHIAKRLQVIRENHLLIFRQSLVSHKNVVRAGSRTPQREAELFSPGSGAYILPGEPFTPNRPERDEYSRNEGLVNTLFSYLFSLAYF